MDLLKRWDGRQRYYEDDPRRRPLPVARRVTRATLAKLQALCASAETMSYNELAASAGMQPMTLQKYLQKFGLSIKDLRAPIPGPMPTPQRWHQPRQRRQRPPPRVTPQPPGTRHVAVRSFVLPPATTPTTRMDQENP